ncbi:7022_t:CDS:2, partial [Gigaspora margarita]
MDTDIDDLYDTDVPNTPTSKSQNVLQVSDDDVATSPTTTIKPRSPVSPFFSQKTIDNKMVICSFCKNKFSVTTATGNLRKHLDSQHPGWNTTKPPSSQQLLTFTPEMTISSQILTPAQKTKLRMLVAEWI